MELSEKELDLIVSALIYTTCHGYEGATGQEAEDYYAMCDLRMKLRPEDEEE